MSTGENATTGGVYRESGGPKPDPIVRVRIFGRTDVGMIREHNEDNFIIADLSQRERNMLPQVRTHEVGARGTLLAVCDGMGGAAAGEVASKMAVDTIYEIMQGASPPGSRDQFAQRLSASISEAGARIYLAAKANRSQRGMGTTSTVAGVFSGTLFVGQVGDSRAYLFRKGKIKQITKDQSLVSKLIEAGQLTEEEAETYEHQHIILQALGTSDTVSVDLSFVELRQGDAVLVCSDGLSGLITSEQMREVLSTVDEPADACKRLTELANEAGGHDNITVIVARFGGEIPPPSDADEPIGYKQWVLQGPAEIENIGRARGKIKGADAPPPGKDVKFAPSIRPPPMDPAPMPVIPAPTGSRSSGGDRDREGENGASASEIAGPDDETELVERKKPGKNNGSSRNTMVVFFVALMLGLLAAAAWLLRG